MSYITQQSSDHDYVSQVRAFIEAAAENAKTLGLSDEQIAALVAQADGYEQALVDVVTIRAAYAAAVTAKEAELAALRKTVGQFAKTWRANADIPDDLLARLEVAPHDPKRTQPALSSVRDVVVTANGTGELTLRWHANGNTRGTLYMVQTASSPDGIWSVADTTTTRKFVMLGTPGTPIWFRVIAKRGRRVSPASTPVAMWTAGALRVAA